MKDGISIAGNLIVDYVKMIDTYPKIGMLCNILDRSQSVGGCATNTLGCIAAMDKNIPLFCHGSVGVDEAGKFILDFLKENHINKDGVIIRNDVFTSFTDAMTVYTSGERTFFQARGANAVFGYEDLDFDEIASRRMFHIGYALLLDKFDEEDPEYGTVMAKTLRRVQSLGVKTSMDVVSEDSERFGKVVRPSLKFINYFIANEIEGGKVSGIAVRKRDGTLDIEALKKACEILMNDGVKDLVVLHAPEGGIYLTKDGESDFVSSLKLPEGYIKGSTGAGDAFCAGILYSLYMDYPLLKAMKIANAVAAANLSMPDSISGLRPISDIMELTERYG